ncbi:MAG: hypothetical protein AAFX85_12415 [Pseudomonadota bacterium]
MPLFRSLTVLCLLIPAAGQSATLSCPTQLFASDFDGQPEAGSKAAVREAVAAGAPLRLGWELDFDNDGVGDLSHWAEADFLTEWEGEVFAQVRAIHRQRPVRGDKRVELPAPWNEWRGILGTDGSLSGALSTPLDSAGGANTRGVRIVWCNASAPAWRVLYRHDAQGEPLEGSLDALHRAIRAGQSLRIGWGVRVTREGEPPRAVEHMIAPVFLTITGEGHVSAQLPEHVAQRSYSDINQSFFAEPPVLWRGLMTTRGTFDAVWVDRGTGEQTRRAPQRAALTWYGLGVAGTHAPTLAVDEGVMRDAARADERMPR